MSKSNLVNYEPKHLSSDSAKVKSWSVFSLAPQTEEAIEKRMRANLDSVCVSYICRFSNLSCDFIERMLALTTGVITEASTEEEIQKLTAFMVNKLTNKERDKKAKITLRVPVVRDKNTTRIARAGEAGTLQDLDFNEKQFSDRVDWVYIGRFQALSNEFIEKFSSQLDLRDLYANEKVDKAFVASIAKKFKGYNQKTSAYTEIEESLNSVSLEEE